MERWTATRIWRRWMSGFRNWKRRINIILIIETNRDILDKPYEPLDLTRYIYLWLCYGGWLYYLCDFLLSWVFIILVILWCVFILGSAHLSWVLWSRSFNIISSCFPASVLLFYSPGHHIRDYAFQESMLKMRSFQYTHLLNRI